MDKVVPRPQSRIGLHGCAADRLRRLGGAGGDGGAAGPAGDAVGGVGETPGAARASPRRRRDVPHSHSPPTACAPAAVGTERSHACRRDRRAARRVRQDGVEVRAGRGRDDHCTRHDLRHTAITWAMRNGVDKWEAAGFFGVGLDMIERVYGHHHPDYLQGRSRRWRAEESRELPGSPLNRIGSVRLVASGPTRSGCGSPQRPCQAAQQMA